MDIERTLDSVSIEEHDSLPPLTIEVRVEDIAIIALKNSLKDSTVMEVIELYEKATYRSILSIFIEDDTLRTNLFEHVNLLNEIAKRCSMSPSVVAQVIYEYRLLGRIECDCEGNNDGPLHVETSYYDDYEVPN